MRLENGRIFRVASETHFPLSVFVGETGLTSAADAMVEKIQFQKILKNPGVRRGREALKY